LAGGVGELGFGVVAAAGGSSVAAGEGERLAEGDWAEIVDFDMAGHGEDAAGAVGFAHGFVEEGGDDASVGVAGRADEAAGETEMRDDVTVGIDEELEAEAGRVF
jgi:hypothetical protein